MAGWKAVGARGQKFKLAQCARHAACRLIGTLKRACMVEKIEMLFTDVCLCAPSSGCWMPRACCSAAFLHLPAPRRWSNGPKQRSQPAPATAAAARCYTSVSTPSRERLASVSKVRTANHWPTPIHACARARRAPSPAVHATVRCQCAGGRSRVRARARDCAADHLVNGWMHACTWARAKPSQVAAAHAQT